MLRTICLKLKTFCDNSMSSSVIYESIENNECKEMNVISNNTKNANEFCANNCELII
jgi:hypothetical protein